MAENIEGKKIIIAVDRTYETSIVDLVKVLQEVGIIVHYLNLNIDEKINIELDRRVIQVFPDSISENEYIGIVLSYGRQKVSELKKDSIIIKLVNDFMEYGRTVVAFPESIELLLTTKLIKGRYLTSGENLKEEFQRAGAHWKDESIVSDNGLVSIRQVENNHDVEKIILKELLEEKHVPRNSLFF